MLTGWEFDGEGKKATVVTRSLWLASLFSSGECILKVEYAEARKHELVDQIRRCFVDDWVRQTASFMGDWARWRSNGCLSMRMGALRP